MRMRSFEGPADGKVHKDREGELIRTAERFWLEKMEMKMWEMLELPLAVNPLWALSSCTHHPLVGKTTQRKDA